MDEDGMVPTVPLGPGRGSPGLEHTRLGRYLLLDRLGQGGMGIVHRAYDPDLDRTVALKVLEPAPSIDGREARVRMLREARLMARLDHPNVVRVHDVGELGDRVYVAMELVTGGTLRSWLRQEPRSRREILRVFAHAGRGLAAAHDAGLVHRDFKPDNVLVAVDGSVRVTDFGLARPVGAPMGPTPSVSSLQQVQAEVTGAGMIVGTPAYMAPEQFLGERVDGRTDQFAFCIALWEALAGARPFRGEASGDIASAVIRGEIAAAAPGHHIPGWLRRILLQGLHSDRTRRFRSMHALLDAIARQTRRRRLAFGVATALVVSCGFVAAGHLQDPCQRPSTAPVWTQEQQATVEDALTRATPELGSDHARLVVSTLDRWTGRWQETARRACELGLAGGDLSDPLHRQRESCLERRRSYFERLVAAYLKIDRAGSVHAIDAAYALPDSQTCLHGIAEPADSPLQIVDAEIAVWLGHREEARSRLNEALEAGGEHPHGFMLRAALADDRSAEEALHRAAQVSERARFDAVVARAWVVLAARLARDPERLAEAEHAAVLARGAIDRAYVEPGLEADLEEARARIAEAKGQLDAPDRLDRVVELRQSLHDLAHPDAVESLRAAAEARLRAREPDDAVARALRALAAAEMIYGARHPRLADVLETVARAFDAAARPELAATHRARAARIGAEAPQ